jgi:hypothetical protein
MVFWGMLLLYFRPPAFVISIVESSLGPTDLSASSLSGGKTVPTVMDNLYKSGEISDQVLGVFFQPTSESNNMSKSGELLFGGVDSSKTSTPVAYVSVTKTSPASEFWGIDQSITYGTSKILSSKAGIVDTGMLQVHPVNKRRTTIYPCTQVLRWSCSQRVRDFCIL